MPYIYSSLSNDNVFHVYDKHPRVATPQSSIVIKGKANVQDKVTFQTPRGAATEVSADELELLKTIPQFAKKLKRGFFSIDEKATHAYGAEDAGADMPKDKSAQDTKKDYDDKNKKAPKEEKGDK